MRVTHLDHFNIRTRPTDLAAIRDFYVNVLGLTEGPRPKFGFPGYWLYGGAEAAILHLAATLPESSAPMSATKPTGQFDHISLKASGVESAKARLTAHGVAFEARPVTGWNLMQLFFTDPAGLRVELTFDMEREANALAPTTLADFAARAGEILESDNSPAGREKVAALLRAALQDRAFVEAQFDDASPERKIIYQHPRLGFCILAHRYQGAKSSPPHDHGPSWAIYGQADGETAMSDWAVTEMASLDKPGKVKKLRDYRLTPGSAHVYNEGDLHSPSRAGPTRLIRIEGTNMDAVTRLKWEPV